LRTLHCEFHGDAPIFVTRGQYKGSADGGRPWQPHPLLKRYSGKGFRAVRTAEFGHGETSTLADFRRSGAVEGMAGGAAITDTSQKMANTLMASNRLQKTYTPANVPSVVRFDQARAKGKEAISD
jgi:hypothetical protein